MRFQSQINLISLDLGAYQNAVEKELGEQTKEAARTWLTTVLAIVPTWSRASRATFNELAEAVNFPLTFGPQRSRKDRLTLGLSTGRGGLEFTKETFFFFYETDLRYLAYNEFNNAIPGPPPQPFGQLRNPTPYKFTDAGRASFESFAENVRLPDPTEFIRGRRI